VPGGMGHPPPNDAAGLRRPCNGALRR
jgi:hypothetical protein